MICALSWLQTLALQAGVDSIPALMQAGATDGPMSGYTREGDACEAYTILSTGQRATIKYTTHHAPGGPVVVYVYLEDIENVRN